MANKVGVHLSPSVCVCVRECLRVCKSEPWLVSDYLTRLIYILKLVGRWIGRRPKSTNKLEFPASSLVVCGRLKRMPQTLTPCFLPHFSPLPPPSDFIFFTFLSSMTPAGKWLLTIGAGESTEPDTGCLAKWHLLTGPERFQHLASLETLIRPFVSLLAGDSHITFSQLGWWQPTSCQVRLGFCPGPSAYLSAIAQDRKQTSRTRQFWAQREYLLRALYTFREAVERKIC